MIFRKPWPQLYYVSWIPISWIWENVPLVPQRADLKARELNESRVLTLETRARYYYRVVIELIAGPLEPGLQLEIHCAPDTNKLLGSYQTAFILSA